MPHLVAEIRAQIASGRVNKGNFSHAISKEFQEVTRLLSDREFLRANCRIARTTGQNIGTGVGGGGSSQGPGEKSVSIPGGAGGAQAQHQGHRSLPTQGGGGAIAMNTALEENPNATRKAVKKASGATLAEGMRKKKMKPSSDKCIEV